MTIQELNNNCDKYTRELNQTINFHINGKSIKILILKVNKKGTKRVFYAPYTEDLKKLNSTLYARKYDAESLAKQYAEFKLK